MSEKTISGYCPFNHFGCFGFRAFWLFDLIDFLVVQAFKSKLDAAWANTSRPQWNIFNSKMYVCNKPLLNPTENERVKLKII
jgi:hypothetical protein